MSERSTLFVVLIALNLGSSVPAKIGENAFYALLGAGWAIFLIWTVVAWRRGKKVLAA